MSFPNDVNFTYKTPPKPEEQVGGTHYSRLGIEPIQFIETNGLGYHEGNVIKYVSRWRNKNGLEDLKKAKWYIERLIELETTGEQPTLKFEESNCFSVNPDTVTTLEEAIAATSAIRACQRHAKAQAEVEE